MKTEIIKNKEGEVLTTKEGVKLTDNTFVVGDVFVPKTGDLIKDKNSKFDKYKLVCNVKDSEGVKSEEVFITLTPAQVKTINKAIEEEVELNQIVWKTYSYTSDEKYGSKPCIGISYKDRKSPISLE
jgi:hypothetical protein